MKRKAIYFAIVLIFSCLTGCRLEMMEDNYIGPHEVVFRADFADRAKTILNEDDHRVYWSPNDSITLFVVDARDGSNRSYTLKSTNNAPSTSATFKGVVDKLPDSPIFYAVHPASVTANLSLDSDGNVAVLDVPKIQRSGDDCFDAFITVAKSDTYDLAFKQVMSGFSFSVERDDIRSVEVSCPYGGCPLSGNLSVDLDDLAIWSSSKGGNTKVVPSQGDCFIPGETYYVALPTRSLSSLKLTYRTDTEYAMYYHGSTLECVRGRIYNLGTRDKGLQFSPESVVEKAQITDFGDYLTGNIKRVEFVTNSSLTTDIVVESNNYPVYVEISGTTVKFHTSAPAFSTIQNSIFEGIKNTVEYIDMGVFDFSDGDMKNAFEGLQYLQQLDLSEVSTKGVTDMSGCFAGCKALKSVDLSSFDAGNVFYMSGMFSGCESLEEVSFNQNITVSPKATDEMFLDCYSLTNVDISSFDMTRASNTAQMFGNCFGMSELNLGEFGLGDLGPENDGMFISIASKTKACKITCGADIMENLKNAGQPMFQNSYKYITWYKVGESTPTYSASDYSGLYSSTDYSQDGKYKLLQKATEGNGINVVLLGDYYTDRLIADGTYENDMRSAMEAIFTEEPFASFRQTFNVYQVTAVSPHEDVSGIGALETMGNGNGKISGNRKLTLAYLPEELQGDKLYESVVIVLINTSSDNELVDWCYGPAGTSDSVSGDFGSGLSMMYVTKQNSSLLFAQSIHRNFGCAFAKLADENWSAEENNLLVNIWDIEAIEHLQGIGYLKNISVSNDPVKVPWSIFLSTAKYVSSGLGVYEGGYGYARGVWRPTEDSAMRSGNEAYNVPSREAIYYRIHKLAFGDGWQYSFDDFLDYDKDNVIINISSVTLDKTSATLRVGESVTLTATVNPSDATNKTVTWSTSDASVATVNDGVVSAVTLGTATITAQAGDKTATCVITVEATPVSSIELDKTTANLKAGETVTLSATVKPDDATDKTVTWSSSDETIASVVDGLVTAIQVGTATITAQAGDKTATCEITVEATPVTSISLDKTTATLKVGGTVTLTATVKPDDATDKTVTWSSSDESFATVIDGIVTAVEVGTAIITAQAGDKTATCEITIEATEVTSIVLDQTTATMMAGETISLTATVKPDDATDKTVTWSSNDETVATVNNGVVTAVKVGTATVTAKAGNKTATCAITVVPTPVTSILLDKTSASLKAGETVTLSATVKPDDATDKTVTWSTSDATVATVNNGVVTAVKVGTATITAKAGDVTATCAITVVPTPVSSITLDKTTASLKAGETVTLTATVNPNDATDKTVTWSTSDATVATVSDGVVTALKVGTATITAQAGDKTTTCYITVVATPVTSVTLDKTTASLKAGETVTLTATVNPDDATDKTVTWSTSDATVATVSNGVVTALRVGTATITAQAGNKTATCAITVVPTPVTSILLNKTSASLKAGETVTLSATVKPDDATDKTVTWSTSDATIATVSNGVVTAVKVGTATITAKAGDITATCAITVVPTPVTSITLDNTTVSLKAGGKVILTATVGPDDATDKTVTWSTSDATVATVSNGLVTAVKVGTATITAKAGDKTATCVVTVVPTPVTGITLNQTTASLKAGETVTLTATVSPEDATDQTVTWSTSDATVATVSNGVVTALKVGTATITAQAGNKTATCAITVVPTSVTSITLDRTSASLKAGETIILTATVKPDDATDKSVTWSTSDATVATVSEGIVIARKVGTATITAQAGDKTATCLITVVTTPVTSITLDQTTATLRAGQTVTLTATVSPDDATDKTVSWSSSDATVAMVSDGVVTAIQVGTATITAQAGTKTATCVVTVEATPVTNITLDQTTATLRVGQTVTLTATVSPNDATDKTVTWSTSDATVATVSNGLVTALKVGTATITAQAGTKTATCVVTVEPTPVTNITLDQTTTTLRAGQTVTLTATVSPNDATDKTVTWITSDATVATVSNGIVTAVKVGSATITAQAGTKTATCVVTVEPTPVTNITLDQATATLRAGQTVTLTATVSPNDATDKTVTWSTSDATVATVSNGVVTAVKVGAATITAQAGDKTATCVITVEPTPVTSVTLDQTTATLRAGQTVTLTATVSPNDATDKTVTWSTSDATVATVSNGVVTALKVGTATITAQAGDLTATCTITVQSSATGISLNKSSIKVAPGSTTTLTATITPSNCNEPIEWTTLDPAIATVNNGAITAIAIGKTTITATVGSVSASCEVTVTTNTIGDWDEGDNSTGNI